ncbi:MAG: class I SAM-dependent methyltransferase [Saprospiraceae bacterium]|nr:MAG: O-methyltransferase [Candidatus Parvibacillus calidus]MBX2935739.1 class I SAM-dependent methyltransferase [Saprospiraceae bacterium]MBK7740309.1 class I SAM-dependent methyltransferase [Candidatus Parvibacillus calidus]MBX7180365.1 class I SAM-dependent methyltransferase [Saprospiraceae bacterium]MCB0592411.1 class I SAM-dependent methyltransferase [Saprospiraceae bacterium]
MLTQLKNFIKFYLKATTLYNVHSSMVYQLLHFLFNNKIPESRASAYASVRKNLLNNNNTIENHDLGAGSHKNIRGNTISISHIAKTSMSGQRKMQWLYNMSAYFRPSTAIELGTSLGLSGSHIAANAERLITIEGNSAIAAVAEQTFRMLNNSNIQCLIGNFDRVLPELLTIEQPDFIYLDGNHTYQATTEYFHLILEKTAGRRPVLVFDDIYWSSGMVKAWNEIKAHPEVRLTIDLYHFGLVLFNEDIIAPRHYKVVPYLWKPWHIGFKPVH